MVTDPHEHLLPLFREFARRELADKCTQSDRRFAKAVAQDQKPVVAFLTACLFTCSPPPSRSLLVIDFVIDNYRRNNL